MHMSVMSVLVVAWGGGGEMGWVREFGAGVARDLRLSWPGNHYLFAVPDQGFIFHNNLTGSHLYRHQQPTHPFLNFLY